MNFFWLHPDPIICAQQNADKHVVKIPLEACQCLVTAFPKEVSPYKHTHSNHPLSIWARSSLENWNMLATFGKALFQEYTFRYGKRHKSEDVLDWMIQNRPSISSLGITLVPRCFAEHKGLIPETDNLFDDYRSYMRVAKSHLFNWKGRPTPEWAQKS